MKIRALYFTMAAFMIIFLSGFGLQQSFRSGIHQSAISGHYAGLSIAKTNTNSQLQKQSKIVFVLAPQSDIPFTDSKNVSAELDPKLIQARVAVSSHSQTPYYITTDNQLVAVENNEMIPIGLVIENHSDGYAYKIVDENNDPFLWIGSDGNLYSADGTVAGKITG